METLLTPVGRMVMGSVYEPKKTDVEGRPLTTKTGTPRVDYFFALAIPKGPEHAWQHAEWGMIIHRVATGFFTGGQANAPGFAWKVVDGDSTVKNAGKVPTAPCDREGYRGHWVLTFTGGFAPTLVDVHGELLTTPNAINCGDFIQVRGSVVPNTKNAASRTNPGIFLNHTHVAFVGYGPRIEFKEKIDPKSIPFSKQLPPGASTVPVSKAFATPRPPLTTPPPPSYPSILKPRVMLPAANGISYEEYVNNKWTDEQLIAAGYMAA